MEPEYLSQYSEGGYRLDGRGSIPVRGKKFLSSPQRPDRLWGPPSLLSDGYRWLFLGGRG
jgi:hypothetical protein